jgi:hypothetical protein
LGFVAVRQGSLGSWGLVGDLQTGEPGLVRARGGGNELDDVLPAILPALLLEKVLPATARQLLYKRSRVERSSLGLRPAWRHGRRSTERPSEAPDVPECSGAFSRARALSPEADDRDELVDQLGDRRVVEDVAQHLEKHAVHVTLRAHDTAICEFPNLLPTETRRVPPPVPTGHAPNRLFGAPAAAQHTRWPAPLG